MTTCQCYQIGGPFIAEDPNCAAHGVDATQQRASVNRELRHAIIAYEKAIVSAYTATNGVSARLRDKVLREKKAELYALLDTHFSVE